MTGGGGYAQYDSADNADVLPLFFEFKCCKYSYICESVAAFRWINGSVFGLSVNGKVGDDWEYMYVHLQKRVMKFTPGLEAEDSFMIIPNEFEKDHELTQEEITALMTPDHEYERAINIKYGWGQKMTVVERVKRFVSKNKSEKIFALKTRLNRLLGRKLSSIWKARVPDYCNSNQSSVWKTRGIPDSYNI